jgi:hypothetical protein
MDFGSASFGSGNPSATYGAAAGVPGTWNDIDFDLFVGPVFTFPSLVDTSGSLTGVTLTIDDLGNFATPLNFDEVNTTGDDQSLMDDIFWYGGGLGALLGTLTISGLAAGDYTIYTYAMAPDSAAAMTNIEVVGSPDPPQDVGGSFAAGHALGVTYALHAVTVSAGSDVVVNVMASASFDSLNGMQVVSAGGGGSLALACDPANVHTHGAYVTLSQSSLSGPGVLHLEATDGPSGEFGYFLVASVLNEPGTSISNGRLCLVAPIGRFAPAAGGTLNSLGQFDGAGTLQNIVGTSAVGSGYDVFASLPAPPGGAIQSGDTWHFQCWYRDGQRSNFSNVLSATF